MLPSSALFGLILIHSIQILRFFRESQVDELAMELLLLLVILPAVQVSLLLNLFFSSTLTGSVYPRQVYSHKLFLTEAVFLVVCDPSMNEL